MKYLKENKWLWLIFPLVILFWIFKDLLFDFLVSGGLNKVNEARKKDAEQRGRASAAEEKADAHLKEADRLKEERERVKGDKNWHKK